MFSGWCTGSEGPFLGGLPQFDERLSNSQCSINLTETLEDYMPMVGFEPVPAEDGMVIVEHTKSSIYLGKPGKNLGTALEKVKWPIAILPKKITAEQIWKCNDKINIFAEFGTKNLMR
jgi:hypothetical protein